MASPLSLLSFASSDVIEVVRTCRDVDCGMVCRHKKEFPSVAMVKANKIFANVVIVFVR